MTHSGFQILNVLRQGGPTIVVALFQNIDRVHGTHHSSWHYDILAGENGMMLDGEDTVSKDRACWVD